MTEDQAKAIFILAGFKVLRMFKIENKYWPDAYVEERKNSPWWLVRTEYGLFQIGWRKRVISISWEDTELLEVVTEDNVTKGETYVHADSEAKAVEYMTNLFQAIKGLEEIVKDKTLKYSKANGLCLLGEPLNPNKLMQN